MPKTINLIHVIIIWPYWVVRRTWSIVDVSTLVYAHVKCSVSKVDMPITITHHIMHLFLNGIWLGVTPQHIQKRCACKRDWTVYSKHDNHYRFNCQQNRSVGEGWLYDHTLSTTIFTMIKNTIFIWVLESIRKVVATSNWILTISNYIAYFLS